MLAVTMVCLWGVSAGAAIDSLSLLAGISSEEAGKQLPLKLTAVVTYSDPDWQVLYVQDGTNSAFVEHELPIAQVESRMHPGQLIEIEGVTSRGLVHRNIGLRSFKVIGQKALPAPLRLAADQITDELDSRRVRVEGWISEVRSSGDRLFLEMIVRPGKILLLFVARGTSDAGEKLLGRRVSVMGVFGIHLDEQNRRTGNHVVWIQSLSEIGDLGPLKVIPIRDVSENRTASTNAPIRIRGHIVEQGTNGLLRVRDDSGSVKVRFRKEHNLPLGSVVDVIGYVAGTRDGRVLADGIQVLPASAVSSEAAQSVPLPQPTEANKHLPELAKISQVRALSGAEAARGYPVHVRGVLTFFDPETLRHFVQDDSAGIYVSLVHNQASDVPRVGQNVEIEGFSGPGDFAPMIFSEKIRIAGDGTFPTPRTTVLSELMTGAHDSQWVSLSGVIRTEVVDGKNTVCTLGTGNAIVRMTVADPDSPMTLVDAHVEVHGVCITIFDERRRLLAVELLVPDWSHVHVEEAPHADPLLHPPEPINRLFEFKASLLDHVHRVRIRGVISYRQSDSSFFVQDETGGIAVQLAGETNGIENGKLVDVVGFPSRESRLPVLSDAVAHLPGGDVTIQPISLSADAILDDRFHGKLVSVEGRVLEMSTRSGQKRITLQCGGWVVDALMRGESDLRSLEPGSVVRVTGIYLANLDENYRIRSFQLLLRSPQEVTLISGPSWLTARRAVWLLGAMGLALVVPIVWVRMLRAQVRDQTRELRVEIEERKQAEADLESEIDERKRLEKEALKTHKQLLDVSRQAGKAEVATSVLHNVGNVLNSVNVSVTLLIEKAGSSPLESLGRVAELLRDHSDQTHFLRDDSRGRKLPQFLNSLQSTMTQEREFFLKELKDLRTHVDHIKEIVARQQSHAMAAGILDYAVPNELMDEAAALVFGNSPTAGIGIVRDYVNLPPQLVDKHKVMQILVNFLRNAQRACADTGQSDRCITLKTTRMNGWLRMEVEDNGVGISSENLPRIFQLGFTTRKDGHGFGLHSGALAAREVGGSVEVQSEGLGKGARFSLLLPFTDPSSEESGTL